MVKITRKLTQELHQAPQEKKSRKSPCALEQKLQCCDGIGYRLETRGAYAQAKLCECVTSCPTCFGRTRKPVKGAALSCRDPSPARTVNLLNGATIPARYAGAKLDHFSNFTGNGKEVIQGVRSWLNEFKKNQTKGLIVGGPVGVGKTYLLCAIAKNLAANGFSVKFVDFMQLLNALRAAYSANKTDDVLLHPMLEADVLIVDELGKGRNNDWEISVLDQLVMGRYNQNKLIVASTNYDLKPDTRRRHGFNVSLEDDRSGFQLDQFESLEARVGSRIYSRLVEMCKMVELGGEDFRKQFINSSSNIFASDERGMYR